MGVSGDFLRKLLKVTCSSLVLGFNADFRKDVFPCDRP
jgi:hypothetical protein